MYVWVSVYICVLCVRDNIVLKNSKLKDENGSYLNLLIITGGLLISYQAKEHLINPLCPNDVYKRHLDPAGLWGHSPESIFEIHRPHRGPQVGPQEYMQVDGVRCANSLKLGEILGKSS